MLAMQPSLFADPGVGREPVRTQLSGGAWVDVCPGWLPDADQVFDRLLTQVPWRAERRPMYDRIVDVPRLLAFYTEGATLPDRALEVAKARLDERYRDELGEDFATAGLCLYRDGNDSVAWHGDRIGRGSTEDTMVAIISLGEPRPLLLRPAGVSTRLAGSSAQPANQRFLVGHGDLLVMGGSCQRTWEHSVPKTARPCGPRISVQFRVSGVR